MLFQPTLQEQHVHLRLVFYFNPLAKLTSETGSIYKGPTDGVASLMWRDLNKFLYGRTL